MYEFFEKLLQERGLTTVEVCRATGINPTTIANWKARKSILGAEYLLKLARYFNVSMEYFLGGDKVVFNPETKELEQTEDYYFDDEAKDMAQFLFANPEYRVLFDASRNVKAEDLKKAVMALGIFSKED